MVDRGLAGLGDQVVADERHEDEHAEQAVDDRGDARQQPDDRLQDVAHPLGRELDDEDRDEERRDERDRDGAAGDQDRAPDQRPGVERVDGLRAGVSPDWKIVWSWSSTLPPGREPGEAVVRERRPGPDEDEDDHRHEQADDAQRPARRASARRAGRTTAEPLPRRGIPPRGRGDMPSVAIHRLYFFFLLVRLNAGTPPDFAMTFPATGLVRTQSANRWISGFEPLVGNTRKMNRDSGYFSFLTFFARARDAVEVHAPDARAPATRARRSRSRSGPT